MEGSEKGTERCGAISVPCALGAWLAYAMFEMPLLQFSTKVRTGATQ